MRGVWLASAAALTLLGASVGAAAQNAGAPTETQAPAPPTSPSTADSLGASAPALSAPGAMTPEQEAQAAAAQAAAAQQFYDSLHRQTGAITLAGGKVSLNVPETYYFLGAEDARRVIVDIWGNPPESAEGIEGAIFPANANPATGSWGALVSYADDGHVDDSEAQSMNYDELMRTMQEGTERDNEQRVAQGYGAVHLTGWAEPPHYDRATHKMYWATLLADSEYSTLNYAIRALGREGVFVVNFVASPEELPLIKQIAPEVLRMPDFTDGNRYSDFQRGDRVAAYGLGGLIAGGAALAVAQKAGLLGIILALGKKFIVVLIAAAAGLWGVVKRMFGAKAPAAEITPPSDDSAPPPSA